MLSTWCVLCMVAVAVAVDVELFSSSEEDITSIRRPRQTSDDSVSFDLVSDTTKKQLTQADRIDFLTAHNKFRSIVDPPADGMPFLTWNDTLEYYAQEWALKCAFKHGNIDSNIKLGQNLWVTTKDGYSINGLVNAWDKEKHDYNYEIRSCKVGKMCGHYTQVVAQRSSEIGCGIAYCNKLGHNNKPGYLAVCNYWKPGNLRRKHPYVKGAPCSDCPLEFPKCVNNLCRRDPLCGRLKCKNDEKLNLDTCLCECKSEHIGPWCGAHPLRDKADANPVVTPVKKEEDPYDYYDYDFDSPSGPQQQIGSKGTLIAANLLFLTSTLIIHFLE